jgi:hypothetical protein
MVAEWIGKGFSSRGRILSEITENALDNFSALDW